MSIAAAAAVTWSFGVAPAGAVSVSFTNITNNGAPDAAAQLLLDVTDGGTGALFDFGVAAGPNSDANIHEIYFDDGALFSPPPQIVTEVGADFDAGSANPGELPGANNANPDFVTSSELLADIAQGGASNGLTIGDDLVLRLVYLAGIDFSDVLAALADASLRVGLHVHSLDCTGTTTSCSDSDAFVSNPPPSGPPTVIPLPATLPLFLAALGGFGLLGWRRREAVAA